LFAVETSRAIGLKWHYSESERKVTLNRNRDTKNTAGNPISETQRQDHDGIYQWT
jgi:hypothetical protein